MPLHSHLKQTNDKPDTIFKMQPAKQSSNTIDIIKVEQINK